MNQFKGRLRQVKDPIDKVISLENDNDMEFSFPDLGKYFNLDKKINIGYKFMVYRSTYFINAPNNIRSGELYKLSINILANIKALVRIEAKIIKDDVTPIEIIAKNFGDFPPGKSKELSIQIPTMLKEGSYLLSVMSPDIQSLKEEINIGFNRKEISIFIQTDKNIYKPSDKINFRMIVVDSKLKPVDRKIDVVILDPKNNRLMQWMGRNLYKGLFTGSFQLTEKTTQGLWTLRCDIGKISESKILNVEEYILPLYDVILNVPTYETLKDNKIVVKGSFEAKYTYGGNVLGQATISLKDLYGNYDNFHQKTNYPERVITLNSNNGITTFELSLEFKGENFIDHSNFEYGRPFNLSLEFVDNLTQMRRMTSQIINIYTFPYQITFSGSPYYKSGLPYHLKVTVSRLDEKPLTNNDPKEIELFKIINYNSAYYYNAYVKNTPSKNDSFSIKIPLNGVKNILINETNDNNDIASISINARFKNTNKVFSYVITAFHEPSNIYMILKIEEKPIKIMPSKALVYSQPKTYRTRNLNSKSEKKLKGTLNRGYIITKSKAIAADSIDLIIQDFSENKIILSDKPEKTKILKNITVERSPDSMLNIYVTTTPNSIVCLSAIDKSVFLLAENNDLTQQRIVQEINSYSYNGFPYSSVPFRRPIEEALDPAHISKSNRIEDQIKINDKQRIAGAMSSSSIKVSFKIPDTMTTWIATAFSLNNQKGLAITENAFNIRVALKFFVSVNLPYSVIRGETLKLNVVVYNYHNTDLIANVSLINDKSFALIDGVHKELQTVSVKKKSGISVYFEIRPLKVGNIEIKVNAATKTLSDTIRKYLLVKAEGQTLYFNKPYLVLNSLPALDKKFSFQWDKSNMIPGSQLMEISVIGDIIGPSLTNIGNLIRLPSGCGEQNMLNFAPNIYIYIYLKTKQLLTSETQDKIVKYTKAGYQQQLSYQRNDGSFSAFGNSDPKGSVWLSAFVLKSFVQAKSIDIIYIEQAIFHKILKFLSSNQLDDGSFKETGTVIHKAMQGGTSGNIALTAFVYIAIKEAYNIYDTKLGVDIKNILSKAETYMVRMIKDSIETINTYDLAILCYALYLSKNNKEIAQKSLKQLKGLEMREKEMTYWINTDKLKSCESDNKICEYIPISLDFEQTSYVLLTLALNKNIEEGIPVLKWLLSQRNSIGGYSSTQDTIAALSAITEFAKILNLNTKLDLIIEFYSILMHSLMYKVSVNQQNSLVLHTFQLKTMEENINVISKGVGSAIIQFSWSYNIPENKSGIGFSLNIVTIDKFVDICTSYILNGTSNMAILEVNALSGYVIDRESISAINLTEFKYFELENGGTKIGKSVCLRITMTKLYNIMDIKPAFVKISDYYQPDIYKIGYITPKSNKPSKLISIDQN
ncbi:CD109 antigen-like [Gordionus sp. m RMFG-2023]|uniref:CD109 antigen-like n=1 Tax=Gordionus sp. m RMFG-2023 TaxID=3053472 RepID=UPI0031FDD5A8